MVDITTTQIAAGLAGTVTIGALILLIVQNVKALVPTIQGFAAEVTGGVASLIAVAIAFGLAGADWLLWTTYAQLFVGWMGAWVAARGSYAMLFKASIQGVPVPSDAEVPLSAVQDATEDATQTTNEYPAIVPKSPRSRKAVDR